MNMLGLCGTQTLFLRVTKSCISSPVRVTRTEWCLPDSGYLFHLVTDTWKEAVDLHHREGGPHDGDRVFSWHQLARRLTQLGSWERWDREGQRWMSSACLPESTHLRLHFPPSRVCGMHRWEALPSPVEIWLRCLQFWWGRGEELSFSPGCHAH